MSYDLSPLQYLILWRLAAGGGAEWNPDIKPARSRQDRGRLVKAGLIQAERKKRSARSRPTYISLTEEGWAWLSQNIAADLSKTRANTKDILQRLLARLKFYLEAKNLTLAEFINSSTIDEAQGANDLESQIESAYYQISGGKPGIRVRLADLRLLLANVPRQQLDAALLSMATAGRAALYRLDDPLEIRPEDRDAVLRTPSGEERHIMYFGGPAS